MYKTHHILDTFGSQNIENTSRSVRNTFGSFEMSKRCTPFWREAHFKVKMCKTPHARTTLGSDVAWQAQGILHLAKNEQDVRVL
jgi:hypothetical protein